MLSQAYRRAVERLAVGLTVLACGVLLRHLGHGHDLQDFAVVVTLFLLAPVWLVMRLRPAWSALARWAVAALLWSALWAVPLLWKRPWNAAAVLADLGRQVDWWRTVAPDLLPFFVWPLVALLLISWLTPRRDRIATA